MPARSQAVEPVRRMRTRAEHGLRGGGQMLDAHGRCHLARTVKGVEIRAPDGAIGREHRREELPARGQLVAQRRECGARIVEDVQHAEARHGAEATSAAKAAHCDGLVPQATRL